MVPVPLSCDHFWTTKDFSTYVEVLHKHLHGFCLFPYCFLKCSRKENVVLFYFFTYLLFSGHRKELIQKPSWNSGMPDSHGYTCFEPSHSKTRIFFQAFFWGTLAFSPSVPCTLVLIPCSLVAPSWSLSSSSLSHKSNNPACSSLLSASAVRVKPTLPRDSRLSTTPGLSGLWLAVLPRGQSKALF